MTQIDLNYRSCLPIQHAFLFSKKTIWLHNIVLAVGAMIEVGDLADDFEKWDQA